VVLTHVLQCVVLAGADVHPGQQRSSYNADEVPTSHTSAVSMTPSPQRAGVQSVRQASWWVQAIERETEIDREEEGERRERSVR
jgi:hypothetical protein